jgi:3D (Asp-Asp-Asp) domain-containing protein
MKYLLLIFLLVALLIAAVLSPSPPAEEPRRWPAPIHEVDLPKIPFERRLFALAPRTSADPGSDGYLKKVEETYPNWKITAYQAMVTAYCPCKICCGPNARGKTATGALTRDRPYGLAVPKELLHSRIHVPGYLAESAPMWLWKADDTGSALEENWAKTPRVLHIDVRFKNHDWARQWGVKYMTVYFATKP